MVGALLVFVLAFFVTFSLCSVDVAVCLFCVWWLLLFAVCGCCNCCLGLFAVCFVCVLCLVVVALLFV